MRTYVCLSCNIQIEFEPDVDGKFCHDEDCEWPGCGYEWPETITCEECGGQAVAEDEAQVIVEQRKEERDWRLQ